MMRIIRKEYAGTVKAPNLRAVSRALDVVCGTLPQLNEPPHRRLDLGLEALAQDWLGLVPTPRPASPAMNRLGLGEHWTGSFHWRRSSAWKLRWRPAPLLDLEPRRRRASRHGAPKRSCDALRNARARSTKVAET